MLMISNIPNTCLLHSIGGSVVGQNYYTLVVTVVIIVAVKQLVSDNDLLRKQRL